jgi:hypothetical protein
MVARVATVAFEGVEARRVDVEVQLTSGAVAFMVVGLGDKAVGESRERVRAAFAGLGLALPAKRLIVNLAPADIPKEGSHYDLPIALALMGAMGILPPEVLDGWMAFGELGLDGQIAPTAGALPASVAAASMGLGLICPEASGPEAAWAGDTRILAARSLIAIVNHFPGRAGAQRPQRRADARPTAHRRPARREGAGAGQARAGDRRRRRPQSAETMAEMPPSGSWLAERFTSDGRQRLRQAATACGGSLRLLDAMPLTIRSTFGRPSSTRLRAHSQAHI